MKKLVIIFWPQAVGKMTVGQELAKITWLKLFHNHMTIDLVSHFFSYATETGKRLVKSFREQIFQEVAQSDLEWMIFTFVWFFDLQTDWDSVASRCKIFEDQGWEIYFVELEADEKIRIERNVTQNRLEHKRTKRDIEHSEKELKESSQSHRLNSYDWEITYKNYMKINNTNLNPEEVALQIKDTFHL